ncbi:MAG: amino acid adenylation domain-containing protein [Waddliaceae bacterium]
MYSDLVLSFIYSLTNEGIKIWHADEKLHLFVPHNKALSEEQAAFIRANKPELIEALEANGVNSKFYDSLILKTQSQQVPLSFAQERLWFIQQYEQGTHVYHIPMLYWLKPDVDLNLLEKSIRRVVDRHEVLRSVIYENEEGDIIQSALHSQDAQVKIIRKQISTQKNLLQSIDEEVNLVFDLSHEIPIRVAILECEGKRRLLSILIHHIAFDGWSMEVFIRDLESFYSSYSVEAPLPLSNPSLQYKDFALWQRHFLKGRVLDQQLEFWKKKLTGYEILNLSTDKPRPKNVDYSGADIFFQLDAVLSKKLRKMAQELQVSLYSLLISAYFLVLRAFSNQDDIIVGTPIANRHFSALKEIVGFFVNNIVLRVKICPQETIETFIQKVGQEVIEAQLHQDLPFEKIVNAVELSKDTSRHPLFQVMFTVQSFNKSYQKGTILEPYEDQSYYRVSYFDITTFIDDSQKELQGQCNFSTSLFKKETIESFISTYQEVLAQFVKHKGKKTRISEIQYLNETAYKRIVLDLNQTQATYPYDQTLSQLFINQAKKTPDAIALVYNQVQLTYQELDDKSTQFAQYLITQYPFPKETVIGLCLGRSEIMVIAILGILKAGYAYVPIDPCYPEERIKFMLNDTRCPLLVVDGLDSLKMGALHPQILVMDSKQVQEDLLSQPLIIPDRQNKPTSLAYVIYTSGTSGTPKGVMVEHRGIVNLIYFLSEKYSFVDSNEQEVILQNINYVFDVSIQQIMLALFNGLKLVLMPDQLWTDEKAFYQYLKRHHVTHLDGTPSQLEPYDYQKFPTVKRVTVGGEFLSPKFYDKVARHKVLYNIYGVTEASVSSTFNLTSKDNLTIGFPISNVTCYVLNRDLSPLPVGAIGELLIGGEGVARGYLNHPNLTTEKFIPNPFQIEVEKKEGKNARLYRTGDLVRRRTDGHIEYLGRNDCQVKIRGQRIELKEIEQTIRLYDKALQCVVTVKGEKTSTQCLVGYIVSKDKIDKGGLKSFLHERLPDFMVPQFIIQVEGIPLTSNGKIDTKSLPSPQSVGINTYIGPQTSLERAVVKAWSDVLGIAESEISVEDSFFQLGGNSILAIKLISKINDIDPSLNAPVAAVFTYRTIREFCHYAEKKRDQKITIQKSPVLHESDQVLSFAQERLWFFDHYAPNTGVYNVPMLFKVSKEIDLERLDKALTAIIQRHEILRTVIHTSQKGTGYQIVYDMTDHPFTVERNHFRTTEKLLEHYKKEAYHSFDLSRDYPIKISINEVLQENYLSIIAHHIAFDGWSVTNFIKELKHFCNGEQETLEELPIQYKDYALWQRKYLSGKKFEELAAFWENKLEDFEPLNFPTDYPRPHEIDYRGANQTLFIDLAVSESLRKVAQHLDLSLHNLLLGAYCMVLQAFSYQKSFVIGIPFANRHFKEVESLIGFFVNTLPIKAQFHQSELLEMFLKEIEREVSEAQIHQDLPFEAIVDMMGTPKDLSRHPIFQAMFTVLEETHEASVIQPYDVGFSFNVAKMDLTLTIDLAQPRFHVLCNYAVSLFTDQTIKVFLDTFEEVLKQIAQLADQEKKRKEIRIQDFHFTNPFENRECFKKIEHPVHKTLHELFEEQVIKTPNQIAVKSPLSELDYHTLNHRANQLAHFLIEKCKVQPSTLLSLFLDRNSDLIVAVLGILKAGGAFVPIDPAMPDERIAYMLKDSNTSIIITNTAYHDRLTSLIGAQDNISRLLEIDCPEMQQQLSFFSQKNPTRNLQSSALAYVIYTSGTTGFPKGVMIEHAGVVNLKHELSKAYGLNEIGEEEVILQSSNYSFDPFVEQIILSLLNGHILLIMPEQLWLKQARFYEFLNTYRVTHINAPPSLLKQYDFCRVPSLKRVVFGGEVLTSDCFSDGLADQRIQVVNVYGPTETTIITTFNFVQSNDLCIGRPIANAMCYILGENGKTLPHGAVGELYIGGIGLARGYLNSPELTEQKFVPNPFQSPEEKKQGSNARLYRTGDLVKRRHDGKLDYRGRMDSQIKIRGYRVELKDIEKTILSIEGVLQSVVMLDGKEGDNKYLVGYFVASTELDTKQMKNHLRQKLPSYMVPVALIEIDKLPMINGKLNYKQLPSPMLTSTNDYREPKNEIEAQLCKIWAQVLKIDEKKISIGDSFFNIGGNSITSIQLVNKINEHFKTRLSIPDLFISESIEILAPKLKQKSVGYRPIHSFNHADSLPHLFMVHPGGTGCEVYVPLAKQLETQYACHGVDSYHLNHDERMESIRELAAYYLKYIDGIMERTRQNHHFLLGWSFGGQLALEMASLLEQKGVKNITVFLLDYVHHDENILNLKKMISPEQAEKVHQEHLVSEGHSRDSIMRMRKALRNEETLMQQPMSASLCDTRIVLFKAMRPGPTFGVDAIKKYQEYVLSLPKNNIDLLVKDPSAIELVQLHKAHHLTVLSNGMQELIEKICAQFHINTLSS